MKKVILYVVAVFAIAVSTIAGAQESSDVKGLLEKSPSEPSLILALSKDAEKCNKKCDDKHEYCADENEAKACASAMEACKAKCK